MPPCEKLEFTRCRQGFHDEQLNLAASPTLAPCKNSSAPAATLHAFSVTGAAANANHHHSIIDTIARSPRRPNLGLHTALSHRPVHSPPDINETQPAAAFVPDQSVRHSAQSLTF